MAHKVKLRKREEKGLKQGAVEPPSASADANLHSGGRVLPWVVGLIALLVYVGTITPGMQMGDGTELAASAHVLGVPHPTGYPLYMMLTKLWLVLTVGGEVITRTTLLNCIIMAAAAGLTTVIVRDLLRVVWQQAVSKPMLWLAGLTGLLTAFLRFHWESAIVTEVYALQFLLTLIFVRIVQRMDLAGGPTRRGMIWLTVVFALAMAHHRLSVTLILPWAGVWVWAWRRRTAAESGEPRAGMPTLPLQDRLSAWRVHNGAGLPWVAALLILVAGAALYLYIPVRAAQEPPINWGNVKSASAFYHHVRGTEYLDRGLLKPGLGQEFTGGQAREFVLLQTRQILGDMWSQINPKQERLIAGPRGSQKVFLLASSPATVYGFVLMALACWGYFRAYRRGVKASSLVVAAVGLQNLVLLYVYNIADIRDYYLFPFWGAVAGLSLVIPPPSPNRSWLIRELGLFIFGALTIGAGFQNYPRVNRSNDLSAELLSATILPDSADIMPAGSILITDDDSETFTTWYRQHVRRERLDVLNFAGNFVYMPWYRAFFTDEQIRDYQIALAPHVARSAGEYTQQLRNAIIDKNVSMRAVFTSINDPAVLVELAGTYAVEPVDAVEITHRMFSDEPTTTVLYRISPKEPAAQ